MLEVLKYVGDTSKELASYLIMFRKDFHSLWIDTMKALHIIYLSHFEDRLVALMDEFLNQQMQCWRWPDSCLDKEFPPGRILKARQQIVLYAKSEGLDKTAIAEVNIQLIAKKVYR